MCCLGAVLRRWVALKPTRSCSSFGFCFFFSSGMSWFGLLKKILLWVVFFCCCFWCLASAPCSGGEDQGAGAACEVVWSAPQARCGCGFGPAPCFGPWGAFCGRCAWGAARRGEVEQGSGVPRWSRVASWSLSTLLCSTNKSFGYPANRSLPCHIISL